MIDSSDIMIKIIVIMMVTMLITATTMTVLMTRYPPFHGFGAHTYNWDCGSAFYDTSVEILSIQSGAILLLQFWEHFLVLFGVISVD